MSTYEPGTVAVATVRGVEGVRVIRRQTSFDGGSADWAHDSTKVGFTCTDDHLVTDVRPLVVLDLDDSAQIDSLCKALVEAMHAAGDRYSAANGVHPATIRAALESLTKPPRIPEPGLWGVVSAGSINNSSRRKWVRYGTGWRDAFDYHADWDDLIDPTLIREGVQS